MILHIVRIQTFEQHHKDPQMKLEISFHFWSRLKKIKTIKKRNTKHAQLLPRLLPQDVHDVSGQLEDQTNGVCMYPACFVSMQHLSRNIWVH